MKILVIGLDAATMDLIELWAREGHLPAIARLMRDGVSGRLLSTPNMHSASAWTSILTGLNPGRHGLFVFSDRDFASGRQVFFKGGDRRGDIIASHLSRAGLRSGLLNVPMTYRAECSAGGFMVSGLDAPSLNEHAFCPAELRADLLSQFPDYNFTPVGLGDLMSAGRIDAAISAWMKLTATQTTAAEYLIETRPVDFFMTVYTASDWGGHNLWKYVDDTGSELSSALLSIYKALDAAVAALVARAGESAQVYVISDHGMGRHSGASYHLAAWLEANGYMARKQSAASRALLLSTGRRVARNILPVAVKEKIKSRIGADRLKQLQASEKDSFYSSIDWARTTAYTEPGRHVINVNLAGRNQHGVVPAQDYEKTCERLSRDLGHWADARGVRVVERVARRDEVYSGPFVKQASDLYVYWNPEALMDEPPPEVRARGFWWSGDHRPEGIIIAKGPGVRSGARVEGASVYDLVPTVMYATGLAVPAGLDGRVIQGMMTDEFAASHRVQTEAASADSPGARDHLSDTDEQLIEEKLRSLGYL